MSTVGKMGEISPEYGKVVFSDNQNSKKKTLEIPIGTKIATTSTSYEVKSDGVYQNGKKISEIPLTLPQMESLKVFDVNKDGKIDNTDISVFENTKQTKTAAQQINDRLARSGSKYSVASACDDGYGGFEDADISQEGFFARFTTDARKDENLKTFVIQTPENKANQEARLAREDAEWEKMKKPWWKFW